MGLLFSTVAAVGQTGSSTLSNPTVVFSSPGVKQVSLTVCNDAGCDTVTKPVTVLDPKPHALSVGSIPPMVGLGELVSFLGSAAGRPPLTYRWVLTKGASSLTLNGNPALWDSKPSGLGTYTGRLEVQNNNGLTQSSPFTITVAKMTFADVPPSYWAWEAIETIYARGLTSGCFSDPLYYCPIASVTRAEMASFLVGAMKGTSFVPPPAVGVFSDVATSFWAAPSIEQIFADGITSGCAVSPLRYCPETPLTRAEMAVLLLRAKHGGAYVPPPATGTQFSDVVSSYWAAPWIEQLAAEGITGGCGTSPLRYCPEENVTRAQMASFLVRAFNLTPP
ncbi:MAG TPA: S-layer homology domain-containing protein [Thermoanaerobaculia bacterium]|nr:S-layer homology domain-containing protein [Thermoanaerobaculia bacterium]